jgi:hypothetical protein
MDLVIAICDPRDRLQVLGYFDNSLAVSGPMAVASRRMRSIRPAGITAMGARHVFRQGGMAAADAVSPVTGPPPDRTDLAPRSPAGVPYHKLIAKRRLGFRYSAESAARESKACCDSPACRG